jgi:hypothetical protein
MLALAAFLSTGMYRGHDNGSLPPWTAFVVLAVAIVVLICVIIFRKGK